MPETRHSSLITNDSQDGREERQLARPDVGKLCEDYRYAINNRDANYWTRQRANYEARYCVWSNQSPDQRKWARPDGKRVFPWNGASDARVPVVDKYVGEDAALLMTAWRDAQVACLPMESSDAQSAALYTQVMRWLKSSQMEDQDDEARLAANLLLERGAVVIGVFWEYCEQLGYRTVTMQELEAGALMAQQQLEALPPEVPTPPQLEFAAALPGLVMNPMLDEQTAEALRAYAPSISNNAARKALKELRETGTAQIAVPYAYADRPRVVTLALNEDLLLPPEATDIKTASAVYWRELLTETQLEGRKRDEGWDPEWVNEVIKTQRGKVTLDLASTPTWMRWYKGGTRIALDNTSRLYEVVHAYVRGYDAQGVPGIWYTCFHAHMSTFADGREAYGYHSLLNYEHGKMPFVLLRTEMRSRLPDDARGYGERLGAAQQQIKVQWDSRIDRASIATLPPSYHPPGEAPAHWGPGVQIPTGRPDSYGFMEVPKYDGGSKEVEETVRRFADECVGRPVDEQNAAQATMVQQDRVNSWLKGWRLVFTQVFQLAQQFLPEQVAIRVVGSDKGRSLKVNRRDIQGQFDVVVTFDVRNLNAELIKEKLGFLQAAIQMDAQGIIDRTEALAFAFEMVDPQLGQRLLRPAQVATASEVKDEGVVFSQLMNGIVVPVAPGQNYQLRLQQLKQMFQSNPRAQKLYQEDEAVKEAFDNRVKQLLQQVQQQQNAVIGRFGAEPGPMGAMLPPPTGGGGEESTAMQPAGAGGAY